MLESNKSLKSNIVPVKRDKPIETASTASQDPNRSKSVNDLVFGFLARESESLIIL
jgi:hypothetical protein